MRKRTLGFLLVAAAATTAAAPSCSCDDSGETGDSGLDGATNGTQTGPGQNGTGQGGAGQGGDSTTPTVTVNGSGGDESGQGGEGGACADITINFAPIIPSVMLLIDQSGSMTENFGGDDRWDVLYETLMDPTDGVVTSLQSQVRFGLALYTGGNNCPGIIDVPIAIDNRDAIDAVYAEEEPEGDTPTGDSIDAVLPGIAAFAEEGPKFIVLCTDGEPDTCEDGDDQEGGREEAIAAAQAAFGMDIGTYVISVGNDVGEDHLQDLANAGVGLPIDGAENAPFWQALDAQGLAEAFDTIINGVRSCVLTVDGEINPEKACDGSVRIDGEEIPCEDPNGWTLLSPTEIELQGDACDLIQSGEHTVDATFPCEAAETSSTSGVPA
jgi:hypothetical protein